MDKLVLASGNAGKLKELQAMLGEHRQLLALEPVAGEKNAVGVDKKALRAAQQRPATGR